MPLLSVPNAVKDRVRFDLLRRQSGTPFRYFRRLATWMLQAWIQPRKSSSKFFRLLHITLAPSLDELLTVNLCRNKWHHCELVEFEIVWFFHLSGFQNGVTRRWQNFSLPRTQDGMFVDITEELSRLVTGNFLIAVGPKLQRTQ